MITLDWNHPEIAENQETALVSQANAAETTLSVINTKGISTGKLLLIGTLGSEDAEIVKTHASTPPTDTGITLAAALKFNHSTDTPVTLLDYDQIEISRASSQGGSYSVIATVDITPDEDGTTYKDATGGTTDYYKIRYKNSIDTTYSGYSAEIPASGLGDDTLAGLVDTVIKTFSPKHGKKLLDRADIVKWLNEGYRKKLARKIIDLDVDYYVKYGTDGAGAPIAFTANQRAYTLPSDFVRTKRWEMSYDGVNYVNADPMDPVDDFPTAAYGRTSPHYYYEAREVVPRPTPTASVGGMRPRYVYLPPALAEDDDVPELPEGYEDAPVNYALKRAFESDQQLDKANYYGTLFDNDAELMLAEIKNRYPEVPRFIEQWGAGEDAPYDGFVPPSSP